ncbi:MAG: SHOCT domain-containing protein [Pseudomonadales bacterium]
MKFSRSGVWLISIVIVLLLQGCVRVDIGEHAPTLGDQLLDLYEARELGAITEAEFERLRRRLVSSI